MVRKEELEELTKRQYASYAFNICKRQKLSVMENVPPCQLFLEPNARPFAIHKPRHCTGSKR